MKKSHKIILTPIANYMGLLYGLIIWAYYMGLLYGLIIWA